MSWIVRAVAAATLGVTLTACGANQSELESLSEKTSYAIGLNFGNSLRQTGVEIDLDLLLQGVQDILEEREPRLSEQEVAEVMQQFSVLVRDEAAKARTELAERNQQEGEAFLAENGTKEGVVTTASGLQYTVLTEGDGRTPQPAERVTVHYRGTLLDGTVFDSSYERDAPVAFAVNGVIAGWTEALQLMRVGSKYQLFIPAHLAYGANGAGEQIGPNATLLFEVELLGIE